MRATGIVRKVDSLGRIVIPKELRRTFKLDEGDALEIFTEEDQVVLRKYEPADVFTGSMEGLVEYKGKKVSRESIVEMAKLAGLEVK